LTILKKLINELLTDIPVFTIRENLKKVNDNEAVPEEPGSIFLQLSDKIDNAKTENKDAS